MDTHEEMTDDTRSRNAGWYLEMLGVTTDPQEPEAEQMTRTPATQVSFELEATAGSESMPTPLEPPTQEQPAVSPSDPSTPEPDLRDWKPNDLAKQVEQKRNFRWSFVVLGAIVVAAVVAVWLWLPTTVTAEANDEAADYRAVIESLRLLLPDAQQTLATATEPATRAIDLFPLSAQLTRIDSAAGEVTVRAARPLPETLPLAPRAALEDLEPTRATMKLLGEEGMGIVARMSATITYRTSLESIFVYPSLPVRADPSQIDGLAVSLAETMAATAAIHAELPLDPAFDEHRNLLAEAIETFATWQETYLSALRTGDQPATQTLIADATALRDGVFSAIVPALAEIRSEVDASIIALNSDTTAAIAALPR